MVEFTDVCGASQNVVTRVIGIDAKSMICINPIAPVRDRARKSPALSTRMTDRIQCSGMAKRLEASVIKAAKESTGRPFARCAADDARAACAASLTSIGDVKIATVHAIAPRDRKAAIVLAAVQGEALSRRPSGRPGLPLRATAVMDLVGTEEWCCIRSNRGMANS
jgi:hypothetical protein